jgi:hypothetical protein
VQGQLYTPNAESFYAQAYLGNSDIVDNFRTLPGVKFEVKIGTVTFGDILQPSTCAFTAPTDQLTAKSMSVCALSSMAQICQFDLEQSFVSLQMAARFKRRFLRSIFYVFLLVRNGELNQWFYREL